MYSGASLNNCPALRQNRLTIRFLRSQNDVLNGFFRLTMIGSLLWNRFSLYDDQKQLIVGFQNGRWLLKMAPRYVFGRIPRFTGSENGSPYGGSSLDGEFSAHWNALKGFQCISMGFFISLYVFAVQRFRWNELMSLSETPL